MAPDYERRIDTALRWAHGENLDNTEAPYRYLLVKSETNGTRWGETYATVRYAMLEAKATVADETDQWPEVIVDLDTADVWQVRVNVSVVTDGPPVYLRPLDELEY